MSSNLITVCIITYNHSGFIRQAIEGVLMQKSDFPVHIIIADDYSTDGTRDILMEYRGKYPEQISLILQTENVGPARNFLQLINTPESKYISYFEGDDYWTDAGKLQKQVDFLEKNEEYVCHCHNAEVIQNDQIVRLYNQNKTDRILTSDDLVTTLGIPSGSIVFRNCLKPMPAYLLNFPLDIVLFFSLSQVGKFYQSTAIMGAYRFHEGGSWSGQDTLAKMNGALKIKEYFLGEMPLTRKQRNLVKQLVVDIRLNRLKYFSNTAFLGMDYLRDLFFLIFKRIAGFKFSAKFLIFCMLPDAMIHSVKKSGTPRAEP